MKTHWLLMVVINFCSCAWAGEPVATQPAQSAAPGTNVTSSLPPDKTPMATTRPS